MSNAEMIAAAESFARRELEQDSTGHDWWHTDRVRRMAARIAEEEQGDVLICTIAALLHDVADEKLNPSKEAGLHKVETWLKEHLEDRDVISHIMQIIATMSFAGGGGAPMATLEGRIVQDADRLDALGAIGIARTMVFSGAKGRPVHDPAISPRDETLQKEYRDYSKGTAVNHFYEKLLKLKDLMNTPYARKLAEERHRFMELYLEQFLKEWSEGSNPERAE